MKIFGTKRYSIIDLMFIVSMVTFINKGAYAEAIFVMVIGAIVSTIVEYVMRQLK